MWFIKNNDNGTPVIWGTPIVTKEQLGEHNDWVNSLRLASDVKSIMKGKARDVLNTVEGNKNRNTVWRERYV